MVQFAIDGFDGILMDGILNAHGMVNESAIAVKDFSRWRMI